MTIRIPYLTALVAVAILSACTQTAMTPEPATTGSLVDNKAQVPGNAAPTPILSLLVGNNITPAARAKWCLQTGSAPFSKIVVQDEAVAAPIEGVSVNIQKDVAAATAPGTASVVSTSGDSQFKIKWQSAGTQGTANITVQNGDSLTFSTDSDRATFHHCPQ